MMTNNLDISLPITPTTWQDYSDRWHPAVLCDGRIWYWPNITMRTEHEARKRASESIDRAASPTEMLEWNIWRDSTDPMD